MGQSQPHPAARGFLRAWASGALLWAYTTRRLLAASGPGEAMLAPISLYLALEYACLLSEGRERPYVPADEDAGPSCPWTRDEFHALVDRVTQLRNEVLHMPEKSEEGRGTNMLWTAEPPYFKYRSSVGDRGRLDSDEIEQGWYEEILAKVEAWLRPHWEHLTAEDRPDPAVLRKKIARTMLGRDDVNTEDPASGPSR